MTTNTQTISQRHKSMRARTALLSLLAVLTALLFPVTAVHAETYVSGNITSNTTWTLAGSPYIVTGDVTVRYSNYNSYTATLTIEPGVVVRFNTGTGLYIGHSYYYGALSAQGTEEAPITFTSNAASPAPGDWKGIYFQDGTNDGATILEHCVVEYGGNSHNANIYCYNANPTIKNSTIRYSSAHGINLNSASPVVKNSIIRENNNHGIYLTGSSNPTIGGGEENGNFISQNESCGIYSESGSPVHVITHNTISDNGSYPIRVGPRMNNVSSNICSGNGIDLIAVMGDHLLANSTWKTNSVPYVVTGDVTIRYSNYNSSTATLTIEPGVVVRFNTGTGLYIGHSYYYGALSAQGTEEAPITFTSNAASPVPGDWKGIYFQDGTNDGATILEHCVVEYGGNSHNANIYCSNAKPTIQYNTIRNSSYSGIYVNGTGSNNTVINCNNLKDNLYGVYTNGNAQPLVHNNNFLRNQGYGIYNSSGVTVDAVNNWWGDVNGPGYNGDEVYGSVTCSPWLAAESDCINTPPTNSPPFEPKNPVPANGAVRVTLTDGTVTVSWAGGDPNPWDTVVYDVYFGDASDNLTLVSQDLELTTSLMSGLYVGDTYYWQVIARDDVGAETSGPVWSFTTDGPPADLTVTGIVWEPADNIEAGQEVTFTATIQNIGTGPVVDAFQVNFKIDGNSIGTRSVSPVIASGGSVQVTEIWTAQTGDHIIEVVADSAGNVTESDDDNNTLSMNLPNIIDPTPPELVSTVPADGASVPQVSQIVITLFDQYGTVDDAAVISSFTVKDGNNQDVAGAVSESNDVFTFIPDTSPLPDDTYHVSLTAADLAGNTQAYSFSFTVDGQPPAGPTITGGAVLSGIIQARPAENRSNSATVTLTGTRDADTSVWINNVEQISTGTGDWSAEITLSQGANALEIWGQDAAGNRSTSVCVDILVDSVAPAITSIAPVNNSFLNTPPATVVISYQEATSGLNLTNTTKTIRDSSSSEVSGDWTVSGNDQLIFTPASPLSDSIYTVDAQLEDEFENRSSAAQYHFTVDTMQPPAPVINPVTSPAYNPTQVISGTKEAYAAIILDSQEIIGHTATTTWQHTVSLSSGQNQFIFAAKDRAGNQSQDATVEIIYDDIPPLPVDNLTANGQGIGTTVTLNWTGYDESVHGDIAFYRIYVETSNFSDISGLTEHDTVRAGTFTYTAENLTKGVTYWFAVVAVDFMSHADPSVNSVSGVPTDTVPPENVTNLTAQSFADRLVFTWDHSANSYGDLAGYHVYFGSETEPVTLPATQNTYERTGLNPASAYLFRVFAYDNDNNDSSGTAVTGYTFLPNPANLSATPYSGYVDLTWDSVSPSEYVKQYRIYVSQNDFISVEGMTPSITTTSTSANVAGLTNNTTYYFAVTTVNKSDGEQKEVSAISATPVPDIQGPEITDVKINGVLLTQDHTLTKPATFTLNASDPAGVSRVEFSIDGTLIRTDYNPQYSCYWDIVSVADGSYTLAITAFDTLSNSTVLEYTVNVALDPPAAPLITQPGNGLVTNVPLIAVSGSAEKNTEVILYHNGVETGDVTSVDGLGNFSFSLTLAEGENQIQAAAKNRAGTGPMSSIVLVTLDTTIPPCPANVTAQARAGGVIRLTWRAPVPLSSGIKGYHLYRATNSFTSISQAQRMNTNLITATAFDDLPQADGDYYYRLTTMSMADNESDLSQEVSAASDRTPPRAVSIDYTPNGNYDPQSGRMAPGTVDVVLSVSEPLLGTPFLSITPEGGVPLSVELAGDSDITYTGLFAISEGTPTGTAYAVFSGRDLVGNRGTEIDSGGSIQIDTDGPSVTRITIQPIEPIKNDEAEPVAVTVYIGLTDTMKPGETPALSYLLSSEGRTAVDITGLTEVTPQSGEVQAWQATFTFPADAGLTEVETLRFVYSGMDDLENVSDTILCHNLFQVYQGELPPLSPPENLTGESLPDGRIRLAWEAVEGAASYEIYRKAPNETEITAYVSPGAALEYVDEPAVDGLYTYAIASIREENAQESVSGLSASVEVASDATAPGAPQNLTLKLVPQGIRAQWEAPPYTEAISYSLYRADLLEITSTQGLTPPATGIDQTEVIDPNPSPDEHCYVVTAVDEAGNESVPSNSFYLNFDLLPVSSLHVVQEDINPPVVSWNHPGGTIAGYNFYLGSDESRIKLNDALLTTLSYTDAGYAGDERRYTVIAVDDNSHESVGRSITLPVAQASLAEGSRIKRGIMTRLEYTVYKQSSVRLDQVRLNVRLEGYNHTSETFSIDGETFKVIPVIVGGYPDLPDTAALKTSIEITPDAGEKIEIIRNSQIEVGDGMMVLQILNEEFTRGGTGKVWFTLENTGQEEIEITTARNSGALDSNEITFYLMDQDENVLSSMAFKQALGQGIVTLPNGNTVARIPAGGTFTSEAMDMPVPANAPDNVTLQLAISDIYFHQGRTDQVKMTGLSATHDVTLIDTAYYGEVSGITPESSTGDQDIIITGRAIERSTGNPMPGAPLDLVISVNGFDRTYQVFTGDDGSFSYTFSPLAGESGIYNVRAVHPDLFDRPVHGQFTITRVSITPSAINLSIPTNYEKTINTQAATGEGTAVNNLSLIYEAADQPEGVLPDGVHLTTGSAVAYLGSKNTASLGFTIWADNTAAETGTLILKVKSDETGDEAWGKVTVNTHFSEALPVLYFSPDHVETGVAQDDTVTENIILENRGLADMEEVAIALLKPDNSPAPNWAYLNTPGNLGSISVGDSREVSMAFSPTDTVTEGVYDFKLRVTSANYTVTDINLYVSVTQSGIGNVLFKISDIYTGTLDANNEIVQGLSGAKVKVQNEEVLTIEETITTDGLGEAYFVDLPAGRYKCRITANNHQEHIGRLWIKPGVTANDEIFLNYNLVTVEWEVNEITIEDKYEIILTAIYETDVPAAVVVAEPSSVTLPAMDAGDVYNGEFTLTNFGLIRADEISFALPDDDQHFTYELLGGLPQSIAAKGRVTVPYRITCVQSLNQDGGTGGGCERYLKCINTGYKYCCSNGVWSRGETKHCIICDNGECTGTGGSVSTGGGGVWTVGGGGGSGSVSSPAPAPKQIDGVICFPDPVRKECCFDKCRGINKETFQNTSQEVKSSVNTVLREYNLDNTDISIKAPGGTISIQRWFYDNKWHHEQTRNKLKFEWDSLGTHIELIDKGGVIYKASSIETDIYTHDIYRITREDTGYRWEDKHGKWKEYDENGHMISYGNRSGVVGKLIYETGDSGKLIGITDRNDNQVIWYEYDGNQLSAVYDSDNRRVEYTYTDNLLVRVTDVLGNETTYEYDSKGRMIRTVDAGGRPAIISYDEYDSVVSVVDSLGKGHFFEFDYDEGKKESYVRITTSSGMIKEIWYDRDGETKQVNVNGRTVQSILKDGRNLIITDEKGNVTRKEFDEWDNLTKVIYADGSEAAYEYEHTFNRKIKETDENGNVTEYEYDDAGNMTKKIEASGSTDERIAEYTYDDDGNLLTTKQLGDAATPEATTVMEYDASGDMTSVTDSEGGIAMFTSRDIMGNVLTKEDARGKVWTYEYDAIGKLTKITDPLNNITQMFYDEVGNKIREVDAEGKEKLFEYDSYDNLIKITDASGNETLFEYNTDNKLVKQTDAEGKVVLYEYDNEGRLVKTTDGNGNEISMEYDDEIGSGGTTSQPSRVIYPTFEKAYAYDVRGRKTQETDVLDDTTSYLTQFAYDAAGNLISKTDKESKTTTYAYDGLSRLTAVTDPLTGITEYIYDSRDNLIGLTDAEGNATTFAYDRNNRLVKETRPMGEETTYGYDTAGNLIEKIDAKNQRTAYTYNDTGKLVEIRYYAHAGDTVPAKTVTFAYDKVGNLTGYDDGTTSAIYGYGDLYRKVSETVDYGSFTKTYDYTYLKNGLKETFTGPDGIAYGYLYDNANQLTGVQIPNVGFITVSEYQWNRPKSMTLPGGSTKQFEYDPLMRVKSITAKDPGQNVLLNYQYTFDKMDNITGKVTEHGDYAYNYDDLYRLADVGNPDFDNEAFTYDGVGNRLTAEGVAGNWSYNNNNELTGYDDVSYVYDDNGNMIQKTIGGVLTSYVYNIEDRLSEVRDGSDNLIASYYYDPFGRRLWKEVSGTKTYYMYADEGLIGEYDASGNEIKSYGWKSGSVLGTDPLFMKEGSSYFFYQNDHLGTPQKMTAINGAVVWLAKYSSFGEAKIDVASTVINPLRLPGQYEDQETGLHYNYHRYYDPSTGRYLTPDPIGLGGGINLFSYSLNNPVNLIDPWGLKEWTIHRYGAGVSLAVVSLSGQRLQFISNCENDQRTIKTYLVFGLGLTVGLKAHAFGGVDKEDQSKGYFGSKTIKDNPNPKWGMAVSGPSAGVIATGGTLASAQLDFNNNYSEIYGATTGRSLGVSIFNAEGQRYFYLGEHVERCCENEN